MPSNYVGNASATETPSPAPAPGATPVLSLPVDTDARNSASIYQALKTPTDYITFIQKAVALDIPTVNAANVGFTTVTYAGIGAATVLPSGSVKISTGTRFVIKIILGGAVGTATFQTSMDGGNTYGTTQTTASSMTDVTSGITLAFAGTFTANGTAAFRSSETPQANWQDANGNTRFAIDHNGYPMGHGRMDWREDWVGLPGTISASLTPIIGAANTPQFPRWSSSVATGGTINFNNPDASYPAPYVTAVTTATSGSQAIIYTASKVFYPNTFSSIVLDLDVGMPGGSGTWQVYFGFSNTGTVALGGNQAYFWADNAHTNWQCQCGDSGNAGTPVDTGITAAAAGLTAFRIEIHGSGSPYGQKVRFFITGKLVAEITTHLPANAMYFFTQVNANAINSGLTVGLGEVVIAANKALSIPVL